MKILITTDWYYPAINGVVTSVLNLKKELINEGNDIVVCLYNLGFENWENVIKHDELAFIDKMVQKGKLRHKAFSCHGPLDLFKEVVGAYDWEMAQIQLNILDEFHQVGVEGLNSVDVNQTQYKEVM